ncbi:hypothetical protein [Mesorhizobium sp. M1D.F.Ca.ET.043.01.1.1]|uniref:hypothetical protein n=1 Tax=Mesorhizobium sp. M1D.F.Ca.ET.043.01.1.1 TaxID=2493669 RepID=UPI000F765A1D|nr:hypothetical protein [Mesorhizobium sp. M1D.F.Ca.ET.043.01.1.1]AZO69991.1 hypothetical protein EJ067_01405 [Mesorhizobium sp. M1D.F.Ca.ET.043.01.1.1]
MSIEVMTKVIQRAPVGGSEFTCMLIMANWCNDDGDSLYPSIALLAEAMRVSRSQAQRILHRLMPAKPEDEAAGNWWFRVVGNDKGGAPGMTRRYQMNVARLDTFPKLPEFEKAEERRRNRTATGRTSATGCTGATGRTGATTRVASVQPDSSEQPSIERERLRDEDGNEFERARHTWPSGFADSREDALVAWQTLAREDRLEAGREIDRFVQANKAVGRKMICSFAAYLREQKWKALPEPTKLVAAPRSIPKPAPASRIRPSRFQLSRPDLYPELFGGDASAPEEPAPMTTTGPSGLKPKAGRQSAASSQSDESFQA